MMAKGVSTDEIKARLKPAAADEEAETTAEIAEKNNQSIRLVRDLIKKAVIAGIMECVWVKRRNSAGINHPVPGFRLTEAAPKKKK